GLGHCWYNIYMSYNNYFNLSLEREQLQVKMSFYDLHIEDDGKVGLVQQLVERMDLTALIGSYKKRGRRPACNPVTMLQIIIFCYSEGLFSCRAIEKACKYDLRL
ncbi:transposase, partial [Peptococcus simiae]|uniref:transposase n=1 Tax=Peptococcus simiae TaxID=1643805 RepID=UPI003980D95B